jgi:hypothetical protein
MAPISSVRLGPATTLEYRYWVAVGSKADVTSAIDTLLAKYRDEKITLRGF